ncbi:TolC family outer membrane protein [Fulvimarina sp. 2208YS6-2-32]|uniref:TolC family outer membrane protein n=1 Tax=Fulvimarina uroteuthidis TaxID=3098149 RepID=A0ABU5I3K9_9HYPH|nr:TolC family outer membrane protein [Fulvimarina sp. 2208YS6-2-32]MDY8109796.1 TolC family outer membrane protein [Fulvimarina sp. 2208YS6-2-32]
MSAKSLFRTLATVGLLLAVPVSANAESLQGALAKAYQNSQDLNGARAGLRATDENVTQARAGMRPRVTGIGSASASRINTDSTSTSRTRQNINSGGQSQNLSQFQKSVVNGESDVLSATVGIQLSQTLFDGFRTPNNVSAAQAQVRAGQYNLSNTEQNTLFDAASAYMDVLRDRQIAALRRQNLSFLSEQVRAARARFEVGEGTRTDVSQAESQEALATALLNSALSQVASSEATYFDVIGDAPRELDAGRIPAGLPDSVTTAYEISQREHPAIRATLAAVDAAAFQVKSAEGALLPTVELQASVQNEYSDTGQDQSTNQFSSGNINNLPGVDSTRGSRIIVDSSQNQNQLSATIGAQLTVPIYQGGLASSVVRQQKEVLGQRRIEVDGTRDQVRAAVATSWAQFQAAKANIAGYNAQVRAAQLALNGVIEERNVGQRTTLDVLDAQADVITARILLVGSQRDEVVAGFALLSSIGRLSKERLTLSGKTYQPNDHYVQVEDKWFGLRTPDGR